MLDRGNARSLIDYAWTEIGCDVQIPADWSDFFQRRGETPLRYEERRRHRRYYLRQRAVLIEDKKRECVYTFDVSRSGIGFLHHRQLLPKQSFRICLANGRIAHISIERCRRVAERCYQCGAVFAAAAAAYETGSSGGSTVARSINDVGAS